MKIFINSLGLLLLVLSLSVSAQEKNLPYFINQSKKNNPVFNDLKNQVLSFELDSQRLKSSYGPQVSASSNLLYAPIIKGFGYDKAITNGQLVSTLLTVNKEIIGNRNLQSRFKSISLNKESISNQLNLSEATLEKNITEQYLITFADQEQFLLSSEILELLLKEDVVLKKLTQHAVFKQTDYLAFKVSLQQQMLSKNQLQAQYLNSLATLNYLSGEVDTSYRKIEKPVINPLNEIPFQNSLYFKSFEIDSLKNKNNERLIHLAYQPKLNLFADAGYQSSLSAQAYKNTGFSAGLNLSIPIYDGKQRKIALAKNNLSEQSRTAYRDFSRQQYQQQILQIAQQVKQYDDLIKKADQQINFSKTLVQANALQFKTGDVRITDYILSVNNYLNLKSAAIQNHITRLQLINQLNYLILK